MTDPRTAPLVAVADILTSLTVAAKPVAARRVFLDEAVGGVLAEPLTVEAPVPLETRALRPGYAVASSDLVGVSAYSPLVAAGPLPWVEAGAAVPPGADAVLPRDAVAQRGSFTEILAGVSPGENVCRAGEDAPRGAVLLERGDMLLPRHAAIARSAGLTYAVVRKPRVHVIASGETSLAVEASLRLAKIDGATVSGDYAGGRLDAVPADLVIVLDDDVASAAAVLDQADRIVARGVALRPGETTQVVLVGTMPVVVLPARLDGLFAVSHCIVRPFLQRLCEGKPDRVRRCGPLSRKLSSTVGLTEVALLRETLQGVEPLGVGRLSLSALARAHCWLALPPESEGHQAGDMIDAFET